MEDDMTKLKELKAAYETATAIVSNRDPEELRATNCDVAHLQVPFTMYETVYTYSGERLIGGEVKPITVTRYGINHAVGATAPSITFTSWDGHSALGSLDMFYICKDWAQAEVDQYVAEARMAENRAVFTALANNLMPQLLEAVELLETVSSARACQDHEFDTDAWFKQVRRILKDLK